MPGYCWISDMDIFLWKVSEIRHTVPLIEGRGIASWKGVAGVLNLKIFNSIIWYSAFRMDPILRFYIYPDVQIIPDVQTHIQTDIFFYILTLNLTHRDIFRHTYWHFTWNIDTHLNIQRHILSSDRHTDIFLDILTVFLTYKHPSDIHTDIFFYIWTVFMKYRHIFWQTYRHFHSCIDSFPDIQTHILTDIQTFSFIHWQF